MKIANIISRPMAVDRYQRYPFFGRSYYVSFLLLPSGTCFLISTRKIYITTWLEIPKWDIFPPPLESPLSVRNYLRSQAVWQSHKRCGVFCSYNLNIIFSFFVWVAFVLIIRLWKWESPRSVFIMLGNAMWKMNFNKLVWENYLFLEKKIDGLIKFND